MNNKMEITEKERLSREDAAARLHALADDPRRAHLRRPGAASDGLPEGVVFMPKPWRGLDVLVQAEKAVHEPQPPVT